MEAQKLSQLKLSEIWEKASKELKRVKGDYLGTIYGDAKQKEVSVIGAIVYYLSDGRTCHPLLLAKEEYEQYLSLKYGFEEMYRQGNGISRSLVDLDESGLSFAQLAKMAKEYGL